MKIYTIGFTKKSASSFFGALQTSGAKRLVDVRLNNRSQLAGFAKKDDLAYFLEGICGIGYIAVPELAPTQEILRDYRKGELTWDHYRRKFLELMRERRIEETVPKEVLEDSCLLCSEHEPDRCHRVLVVQYLQNLWGDIEVVHLGLGTMESERRTLGKRPPRSSTLKSG